MKSFTFFRGIGFINLKKSDESIADFTKALTLNPKLADAWNLRGIAYLGLNDFDKAIADFRKALQLDPNNADAKKNLGLAKTKQRLKSSPDSRRSRPVNS